MQNMTLKEKLRSFILFVLIIAIIGAIIIFTCFVHTQKFAEEPIEVESEVILSDAADVKPANNSTNIPLANEFVEISDYTGDYKYILYEPITGSNKVEVKTVSAEEFEAFYQETPFLEEILTQTNHIKEDNILQYIELNAASILETLTADEANPNINRNKSTTGLKWTYIKYNKTELEGSALPGKFAKGDPWSTFNHEQLDLEITNVEIKKVIGSKRMAEIDCTVAVIAEADVKTISNKGKYKSEAWIPKEGETDRIAFIITYANYSYPGNEDYPNVCEIADIGLLNTTPLMAINNIKNYITKGYMY